MIKVLDCTLRDGGRIINCAFKDSYIKEVSSGLAEAKIDIVEIGFLRDCRQMEYLGNSTFFYRCRANSSVCQERLQYDVCCIC